MHNRHQSCYVKVEFLSYRYDIVTGAFNITMHLNGLLLEVYGLAWHLSMCQFCFKPSDNYKLDNDETREVSLKVTKFVFVYKACFV